jgi:hypothetical protein
VAEAAEKLSPHLPAAPKVPVGLWEAAAREVRPRRTAVAPVARLGRVAAEMVAALAVGEAAETAGAEVMEAAAETGVAEKAATPMRFQRRRLWVCSLPVWR